MITKDEKKEFLPPAMVWTMKGKQMTCLLHDIACQELLTQWCNKHTSGEYVITPIYVCFEHESEATFFKLRFDDGKQDI